MSRTFHTLTIPGGGIRPIEQAGFTFAVVQSPIILAVKWTGADWGEYEQGDGEDLRTVGQFKRLEIRNPSTQAVTVVIYVGDTLRTSNRVAIMEPRTRFHARAETVIAAGAGVTLSGPYVPTDLRRKAVLITNEDPANPLQVRDAAGNVGHIVFAQTSITLPISEPVEIFNSLGAPVAVRLAEIWWQV